MTHRLPVLARAPRHLSPTPLIPIALGSFSSRETFLTLQRLVCFASSSQTSLSPTSLPSKRFHHQQKNWAPQPAHQEKIGASFGISLSRTGSEIDSTFLDCCEPGERLKIGVLLSGGVDSSVALRLLCAAGHSCTAFYLKIWFQEDFENYWASCPWDEDLKFAQAVCDEVGVEFHIVQLTEEYWDNVVSYMIAEYQAGRTPNPDILCNSRIKFGVFLELVRNMDFDRIASGHYAKVVRRHTSSEGMQAVLHLSKDEVKDQTYFLSHLSHSQLLQLIFPLGCLTKGEVRQLADWMGLPNRQRKDSQGICFLGKVKFSDFICRHLGESEGRILEAETGKHLGSHKGFWFYTIGQRQGLRLSNGPWYVVDKDLENNVVFVSRDYFSVDKRRRVFEVHSLNWFGGHCPKDTSKLRCKVRHGPRFYDCSLAFDKWQNYGILEGTSNCMSALVQLSEDDQGIAAGQYTAFYDGNVCLGSGVVSESRADQSSAVSVEARKAAKVKDSLVLKNKSKSMKKKIGTLRGHYSDTDVLTTSKNKVQGDVLTDFKTPSTSQEKMAWVTSLFRLVKKHLSWLGLR